MIGLVLNFAVGLLLITIGLVIWKKQKITLMHSYHYKNVKEEDKPKYCEDIGKNIIGMGIVCFLFGTLISGDTTNSTELFLVIIFFVVLTFNIIKFAKIQKKYNGSVF